MDQTQFWQIIANANDNGKIDPRSEGVMEKITEQLKVLSLGEVTTFDAIFSEFHSRSYNRKLWQEVSRYAWCSDDGFDYFRAWLIGCGEQYFTAVLQNPVPNVRTIFEDAEEEGHCPSLEELNNIGFHLYMELSQEEVQLEGYDWLQKDNIQKGEV